ncbi:MAG TPA: DUF882 domain-containing protein [Elusimicrobiales bacterium]|nr:DUF882 domain-containing protein [Elusimicrobiales bacterium]
MKTTLAALISLTVLILSAAAVFAQKEISASDLMERLTSMAAEVPPPPRVTEAEVVELEEGDPETYIFIKEAKAHPPEPENLGGDGVISLTRMDNGETLSARYRRRNGAYSRKALARISGLMRCSLTGRETQIAVKLVELLDAVEDRFGGRGIVLLSGYRTPRHNGSVPGAARRSLHMLGWAADIAVPGQTPDSVAEYATSLRAGGVGRYPDAGFTHLDAGRSRYWSVTGSRKRGR